MGRFTRDLHIRNADKKDDGKWIVCSPFGFISDDIGDVYVPAGFKTDLASVPRIPIIFELFGDTSCEAAVIHDFLYSNEFERQWVTRYKADCVLLEASKATDVPKWRRYPIFWAVRLFGWLYWHKKGK